MSSREMQLSFDCSRPMHDFNVPGSPSFVNFKGRAWGRGDHDPIRVRTSYEKSLPIAKGLVPGSILGDTAPRYPVLLLIFAPATGGHFPRHLLPRDGIRAHAHKLLSHLHVGQYTCMEKVCRVNYQSCYQGYTIGPLIMEYHYCNT